MNSVGERFFSSINFDSAAEIGLSFLTFKKINDVWEYTLLKKKAWKFSDFISFTNALTNIAYPCSIVYVYETRPTVEDALLLFDEWYKHTYFVSSPFTVTIKSEKLLFQFVSEEEAANVKNVTSDFKLLLKEINYLFEIETLLIKEADDEDDFVLKDEDAPFIEEDEEEVIDEEVRLSLETHAGVRNELEQNYQKMLSERKNKTNRQYNVVAIKDITAENLYVDFDGVVYNWDRRVTKNGVQYSMGIGKVGAAISVRFNERRRDTVQELFLKSLKNNRYVRIQGEVKTDTYRGTPTLYVAGARINEISAPPLPGDDYQGKKRIELHLHTRMSALDAVSGIEEYAEIAKNMGHEALAVTDHGVVQAFPEAQKAGAAHNLKMIYGSELYVVDETLKFINNPSPLLLNNASYVVFDLETTGLSARYNDIIEFGAVLVEHGLIAKRLDLLINPGSGKIIPPHIEKITNISNELVKNKPVLDEVLPEIIAFIGDHILVSHNAEFDLGFLNAALRRRALKPLTNPTIDTLALSRYLFPESRGHRLGILARNLEVMYDEDKAHRADFDAEVLNSVWQAMLTKLLADDEFLTHSGLASLKLPSSGIVHLRPVHATVYVKNKGGLKDLYKIISVSHTEYSTDIPKTPRTLLQSLRGNLLIGSGCFNGEVFTTAARHDESRLLEVMAFYDFIEIQPFSNYSYLIHMGELDSEDHLRKVIKDIKNAAQKLGKPLVATGDVHYALPSDKIYRDVYIVAKGLKGVKHPLNPYDRERKPYFENPDQHYRSTSEMFSEFRKFNVFSEEELQTMIVDNTHRINDLIDHIEPFTKELYKPSIENVDELLTSLVYENAYLTYGDPLPDIVNARIEKELAGIIKNGYAVIYYLAHQIVKKATDNKFIVGSRGSVGSSIVAHFAKVSEVNPLPPHYYCTHCQYSDFHNAQNVLSGFDLPPKKCPQCGELLKADGQNIPFETFLGFAADKIPDIDLNFPEDFQKEAHNYTKVLFGEQNAFRAGTIQKVADKTAYGYVLNYFETMNIPREETTSENIAFLASKVAGTKRTTGQHPGGIVVIPSEYEVYNFTPVQYPASNVDSNWLTTHFDYDSMHDNLLKLDLLGHKDPVALKMLCDLTGIDFNDVPTNDLKTLSLFSKVDALKLETNPLSEKTGALGLPEFGTQFVRQILSDAQPISFNDLVIVSGLSHGTGVWRFNADELIRNGTTDLRGVIGCRDDIMTYLIRQGMAERDAFTIMERVRKGQSIDEELEGKMKAAGIPPFYIDSCKKIEYLFPRAHAVAYVIMAVKVAWFKLYHPLSYYATFFTIRGDNFDLKTMISGQEAILKAISDFDEQRQKAELNPRDTNILENLQLTLEMMNRGYKLANIDLYKSEASTFIVDEANGQIIPPFIVLKSLGEAAGQSVVNARADGEFISIEDLVERTKLNTNNIESLKELGVLNDLPESNQMSLFDFGDY